MPNSPLLLICHGSRDPRYAPAFEDLVASCQRQLPVPVLGAYLEATDDPLAAQILKAAHQINSDKLRILPLFMGRSGHVDTDIPEAVAVAQVGIPEVQLELVPALGQHSAFLAYLQRRLTQHHPDGWILWAHGSRVGSFAAYFNNLASQLQRAQPGIPVVSAFYVNVPSLDTQLDALITQGCRHMAILPLLLFPGGLTDYLAQTAAEHHHRDPRLHLQVLPWLAGDPHLVEVIGAIAQDPARTEEPVARM